MVIYSKYLDPPEPPRYLWLEIDFSKINFNDMNQIKLIYTFILILKSLSISIATQL